MSTGNNHAADVEANIEVIDSPETDFTVLPKENQIGSGTGNHVGPVAGYWGDMSKYTDDDFDHLIPRLIVPSIVVFVKPGIAQTNHLAKMVIQNTSNLPMTYSVQDFPCCLDSGSITVSEATNPLFSVMERNLEIRVTKPEPGWILPKSSVILNIRIDVDEDNKSLDVLKHFALHAAPIFREKHTQKENLELFWKSFDSGCFPKGYAEEHVFTLYISEHCHNEGFHGLLRVKPPKDFRNKLEQTSHEEFNALWVAGEDPEEYKFALELRIRELNRVMKRNEVEAGAKLAKEKKKWLIRVVIFMFFVTLIVAFLGILKVIVMNKNDDDY